MGKNHKCRSLTEENELGSSRVDNFRVFKRRRSVNYVPFVLILLSCLLSLQFTNSTHMKDMLVFYSENRKAKSLLSSSIASRSSLEYVPAENTDESDRTKHHLLIAQYAALSSSSNGAYDQFLDITSKLNQAYAIAWKYDYLILRGVPFADPTDRSFTIQRFVVDGDRILPSSGYEDDEDDDSVQINKTAHVQTLNLVPESRATYNKLTVLELALLDPKYDRLLILDADAMLYDFSRDIASLLPDTAVLMAHKTQRDHGPGTGSINIGVTLWNLRHAFTPLILKRWKTKCLRRIQEGRPDNDQEPLHTMLKKELNQTQRDKIVHAVSDEFAYGHGLFIKHFIRPDATTWNNVSLASRLTKMEEAANQVCTRYNPICVQ